MSFFSCESSSSKSPKKILLSNKKSSSSSLFFDTLYIGFFTIRLLALTFKLGDEFLEVIRLFIIVNKFFFNLSKEFTLFF